MTPRVATTGLFVVNGAVIGPWVSQIPAIQREFDLSIGAMGLVVLCMSVAVILAVPVAGQAVARRGSAPVAVAGGASPASLAVNLPVLAPTALLVAGAWWCWAVPARRWTWRMNSHGVELEVARGPADHVVAARRLGARRRGRAPAPGRPGAALGRGRPVHGGRDLGRPRRARSPPAPATSARARWPRAGRGAALHAPLARRRPARRPLPAGDDDRGRDGRLERHLHAAPTSGRARRWRPWRTPSSPPGMTVGRLVGDRINRCDGSGRAAARRRAPHGRRRSR